MTTASGKMTEFLNNTLAGADGTVHYTYYLPAGYDENKRYPMLVTLPGWSNLFYTIETTPLENNNYAKSHAEKWTEILGDLIVVSPSLTDWGEKSARQTIELTEYFIENFAVDKNKIYAAGFSAGGETLSWVISSRPDLFAAYLHCASHWNGGFDAAASAKLPVYVTMAQRDEYYGAETAKEAYDGLMAAYRRAGISETEIGRLLVLDIKDDSYFGSNTYSYHGAGSKAILDENIIRWLTSHTKF